ncbi:hypothetical protein J2X31_001141 [Flavobacterium arsenatis]|uniref:Uncharacterized protein n=1 Tax=Flavobacterium arsenatis TaxID=1484332 RepID=A0ABU1TME1_9FLAO|nr:hypothetical protein [Flavobacterium arsenatis]MDR6967134.1 hypothetical protein [Flavobacterium arsenatis]
MNDQKFSTAFSKMPKQKSNFPNAVAARTVMEQDYDFIISDDIPAKVITIESIVSYTFHISRENDPVENSDSFENLIVLIDSLETAKAYILKYNMLSESVYVSQHDSYTIDAETELTPINFNDTQARISYISSDGCTVMTLMCPYGDHPHPAGGGCLEEDRGDLYWSSDSSNCRGGGGGSSGSTGNPGSMPGNGDSNSGTSGGGNSNGGSGSGAGSPLVTAPVGLDGQASNNNCKDLQDKTKFTEYKDKMDELKQKAATQGVESGYITYSGDPKFSQEYQGDQDEEDGSMMKFPLDTSRNDQTGFIHCHLDDPNKKNFAVFSLTDLDGFAQIIQNSTAPVSSYTLMVTSAKGTFALKITNKNQFIAMVNALNNNWDISERAFKNWYVKKEESTDKQIEGFLKFFRQNTNQAIKNPGFEFFSCDNNFQNWTKHELDNNNVKKTKKC